MDFDTARTTSRESTSFWGSKIPARGYARETRVTTRRRPLVDATCRDALWSCFSGPARDDGASASASADADANGFVCRSRGRARRGVVRRRDAGASNVDRKPYFLGFRKHGASSRRGSIRRRFFTFLSKFERFSSRFGVATRVKVQIDVTACDVVHRLVSTVRPLERRRRARDSR